MNAQKHLNSYENIGWQGTKCICSRKFAGLIASLENVPTNFCFVNFSVVIMCDVSSFISGMLLPDNFNYIGV